MSKDKDAVRCPRCRTILKHEDSYRRHQYRCGEMYTRRGNPRRLKFSPRDIAILGGDPSL